MSTAQHIKVTLGLLGMNLYKSGVLIIITVPDMIIIIFIQLHIIPDNITYTNQH